MSDSGNPVFSRSYLICATWRTGSNLLGDLLRQTGVAGDPDENLLPRIEKLRKPEWGFKSFTEFVQETQRRHSTPNGVSCLKLMHWNLLESLERLRHENDLDSCVSDREVLERFFPEVRFIFITRCNKMRQAISMMRAIQSDQWIMTARSKGEMLSKQSLHFDWHDFHRQLHAVNLEDDRWLDFFSRNGIIPFLVPYERLQVAHREVLAEVLRFLNLPVTESVGSITPKIRRQATIQNRLWEIQAIVIHRLLLFAAAIGLRKSRPSPLQRSLAEYRVRLRS